MYGLISVAGNFERGLRRLRRRAAPAAPEGGTLELRSPRWVRADGEPHGQPRHQGIHARLVQGEPQRHSQKHGDARAGGRLRDDALRPAEVLLELGYDWDRIIELKTAGAVT